jgi:hypothetical protein
MELCGAQPRHYSELERIHVGGPFHHRIDLSLQKRDHK